MNNYKRHIMEEFRKYTDNYNRKDAKIRLKVAHTYRVAALCGDIARSLGLDGAEVELAWTCGMLHDIGRFEQVKRYGTFMDAESVDHAQFGADLLFAEGLYGQIVPGEEAGGAVDGGTAKGAGIAAEAGEIGDVGSRKRNGGGKKEIIERAIRAHNAFRLPENLTEEEKMYANILRDADKIDILRVNCETPPEEVYNVTTQELKNALVSEDVKQAFLERRCAKRHDRTSAIDYLVGHICLVFELVYQRSRELAFEQGYLFELLGFKSDNKETDEWFRFMNQEMRKMQGQ